MPEQRREHSTSAARGGFIGTVAKLIGADEVDERPSGDPRDPAGSAAERAERRRMRAQRRAERSAPARPRVLPTPPPHADERTGAPAGHVTRRPRAVPPPPDDGTAAEDRTDDEGQAPVYQLEAAVGEGEPDAGAQAVDSELGGQLRALVGSAHEWRDTVERELGETGADGIEAQLASAAEALEESLAESERARERWVELEQRLSENLELQRRVSAELEARHTQLGSEQLEGAELQIRAAEEALAASDRYVQERTELEVRLALLESQRAEIDDELERARGALDEAHRGAEALRNALEERDVELAAERESTATLRRARDEAAARVKELDQALTQSRSDAEEAAAAAAAKLEEVRSAASAEVTRVLEAARGEMERLVSSLATADERARDLEQQLTVRTGELEHALDETRAEATREKEALERQLARSNAMLSQAREASQRDREHQRELEEHIRVLVKERDEARVEAKRRRTDRDALRARLRTLIDLTGEGETGVVPEQESAELPHEPAPELAHEPGPQMAQEAADGQPDAPRSEPADDLSHVRPRRVRPHRRRGSAGHPSECVACHRPTGGGPVSVMRASGWEIENGEALCPNCSAERQEAADRAGAAGHVDFD